MNSILAVLAAVLCAGAAAQTSRPSAAAGEPVLIAVTVKDLQGRLVSGLQLEDFRLFEDSIEQKISGFSSDRMVLSVAVLLDAALSRPTAARVRATFASLVEAFSEFDEVGLFSFQEDFRTVADFTADKEQLRRGLDRIEMGVDYTQAGDPLSQTVPRINNWPISGPPASARSSSRNRPAKNMDDAVLAAIRLLQARALSRRKIILLISDGINSSGSRVSTDELLATLRRSEVAVYSIGLDAARLPRGSVALARYASATGGELFAAIKKTGIEPLYGRITEQARYPYRLSYVSGRPATVAPLARRIEVRLGRPGVVVIARDSYLPEARGPRD